MSMHNARLGEDLIMAAVQRFQGRGAKGRQQGQRRPNDKARIATAPRDPKDNKCANCNQPGHSHLNDSQLQVAQELRKSPIGAPPSEDRVQRL